MKTVSILSALVIAGFALNTAVAAPNNSAEMCAAQTEKLLTRFDSNQDGQISKSEVEEVKTGFFNKADQNADGQLTKEEFSTLHDENQQAQMEAKFAALDSNNDGSLSLAEMMKGKTGARAEARFNRVDSNGDGQVTLEEMAAMGAARGEKQVDNQFTRLDTDKDGVVSQAEFLSGDKFFERADSNSDGVVSSEELQQQGCKRMGGFNK